MKRNTLPMMFVMVLLMAMAPAAWAQQRPPASGPRVGYIYPAGACQGATTRAVVGGQFLDGVSQAYVSGSGVQITVKEDLKPMTMQQLMKLRDTAKELNERRQMARNWPRLSPASRPSTRPVFTPDDATLLMEVQQKLAGAVARPAFPSIAENVLVEITVAKDAAPGRREVRLQTDTGLTNPLVFYVGQLPEVSEVAAKPAAQALASVPGKQMSVKLPVMINGQILAGGVNRYQFQASKGQSLVAAVAARALTPYLADAVPGWFQAALTLYDAAGHELASDDDSRVDHDPLLHYVIPADGQYVVEIKDSLFRGREDFVYRLALGELPYITSVFPLGGPAGAQTDVDLAGWNLPQNKLNQNCQDGLPGMQTLGLGKLDWLVGQRLPFAVGDLPECRELKTNTTQAAAQAVTLPIIINGRIAKPGEGKVFRFDAKAGEQIVAEVMARRLGSPLDSVLELTDSPGKQLAINDDWDDKAAGLVTHQSDSYLTATVPTDGTWFIHLRDTQGQGGADYAYRLRLSHPRPDFQLLLESSTINVRAGATATLTVHAVRRDGFTGAINLALSTPSQGFKLSGAVIPANGEKAQIKLQAPATATGKPVNLHLEGTASIDGQTVKHAVIPSDYTMQAFAYWHYVPAQELAALVLPQQARQPQLAGAGNMKLAGDITAKYIADQMGLSGDKSDKFVAAYTSQLMGGLAQLRNATNAGKAKAMATAIDDISKAMRGVLDAELGAKQAVKAVELLGPLYGVMERDVSELLSVNVSQAKVAQAMPALSRYVHTAKIQVYDPISDGLLSRPDGINKIHDLRVAAAKDLAPIIGADAANRWAELPAMGMVAPRNP